MDTPLETYQLSLTAMAAVGALMLVQLLVVDVVGIKRRHTPGSPVPADHGDLLFRVTRTVANMNESIAVFLILLLYCVLSGADASYTGIAAWVYFGSRVAYAGCYFADVRVMRSVFFGVSLLALVGLLVVGLAT